MSNDSQNSSGDNFEAPRIVEKPDPATLEARSKRHGPLRVVAVSFHQAGKLYDFEAGDIDVAKGQAVIIETDEGLGFATVAIAPRTEQAELYDRPLRKLLRKATLDDQRQHEKLRDREKVAFEVCRRRIQMMRLPMKLIRVEYMHSGAKAMFYFSSEDRVDFRTLVRDLAQELHTRVEMKQVGPRDEAKIMGGIGICGRELCCTTWLRDFDPISIKMAKEQELSLNPSKLAGQCGRLKCCLAYEYESYVDLKRGLPKVGKKVCWKDGTPCGRVAGHHVFKQTIRVIQEDGTETTVPAGDIMLASQFAAKQAALKPDAPAEGQEGSLAVAAETQIHYKDQEEPEEHSDSAESEDGMPDDSNEP